MSYNLTYTIPVFQPLDYATQGIASVTASNLNVQLRNSDGGGTVTGIGTTAIIKQSSDPAEKPTVLYIAIQDVKGTYYTPMGLALKSVDNNAPGANFTTSLVTATASTPAMITLSDANTTVDSWNFVVLFQDASGNFGILDPMISNSDSLPRAAAQAGKSAAAVAA